MKSIIAIFWITIFAAEAKRARIVKGNRAVDIRKMPWMVYVEVNTKTVGKSCSGSIIGEFYILTAAHCLLPGKMTQVTIVTGTIKSNSHLGRSYSVQSYSVHPKFRSSARDKKNTYDIAVLKTKDKLQFSDRVQRIQIRYREISNTLASVKMGYGEAIGGGKRGGVLKYAYTTATKYNSEISTTIVQGYTDYGDSGGPLVACRKGLEECRLIGVATTNFEGSDYYASVHFHKTFIERSLRNIGYSPIRNSTVRNPFTLDFPIFAFILMHAIFLEFFVA